MRGRPSRGFGPRTFHGRPRPAGGPRADAAETARTSTAVEVPPRTKDPNQKRDSDMPLLAFVALAIALPLLRALGIVGWPWLVVLGPTLLAGAAVLATVIGFRLRPIYEKVLARFGRSRGSAAESTPPPELLEPPLAADEPGDRILAEYPEILAALCLGFRVARLQPMVVGHSIHDPWGVYHEARIASPMAFEQIRMLTRMHAQRFARTGRNAMGKLPSDATVMKNAVQAFHTCAAKHGQGKGHPDCPFEHVTVIYGTRSPNRDEHLRSIAPKVRTLLERRYPQLSTARLADGSRMKYDQWQKQAAEDRQEIARLRQDNERVLKKLDEAQKELAARNAQLSDLRASLETRQRDAQAAARVQQQKAIDDLHAVIERSRAEHVRDLQRADTEKTRLTAMIDAIAGDRDALEQALFDEDVDAGEPADSLVERFTGLRVLLVGGDEGHLPAIREFLEVQGIQLVHAEGPSAAELIGSVGLVILWTRFMNHPTYHALKRECKARGVPHCYWARTSTSSLHHLIAHTLTSREPEPTPGNS